MTALASPPSLLAPVWERLEPLGWGPDTLSEVTPLDGGFRNRMVSVVHQGERFAVRLPRQRLKDRQWYKRERHNLDAAAALGLAPQPLLADDTDGFLVLPWVEGSHPRRYHMDAAAAARAGLALRRLREAAPFLAGSDVVERLDRDLPRFKAAVHAGTAQDPAGLHSVAESARPLFAALRATLPAASPCHGDLVLGNMIDTGERMLFIDWETSTAGDPHYDLATVSVRARLTPEARAALLEAWFEDTDDLLGRARVTLWEVLYALDKALTYWRRGLRDGQPDPRCPGWAKRCGELLAVPGTRAAVLVVQQAARAL